MISNKPVKISKTPPGSRGTSPGRDDTIKQKRKNESPNRRKTTPTENRTLGRSPNKKNQNEKTITRSRGNSPAKSEDNFILKSRGSESGSIERLDETNNTQRIITSYNQAEDNINVVVRVRPLSVKEMNNGDTFAVQFPGSGQILIEGGSPTGSAQKSRLFSYNVVFEPAATQEDVLQYSGMKRLIEMAVEGFRCTAFCYGQTGSGKTHTLTGPPGLFDSKPIHYSDRHGLIFRSFLYLFKLLEEKSDVHFVLKASFLEIYNEKVIDLLNPGSARKPLAVRWSKKARGFFVENLFTVDCEELDDLTAVLEEGMRNRSVGSHNMNDYSSRSHTILSVHISSEQAAEKGVFISRSGKINFVDLAGSEMTKKTQSEGKTLEEANNINKSLMVLGYCISSLSDCKKKNNCHIPYRDSQLTKLLADSLAGNGVTLMIACISPAKSNMSETLNTLRYAARAKKVKTKPVVLMDPREALILSLKREVGVLQSENEHLRSALHLQESPGDLLTGRRKILTTPPHVDLNKLAELEGPELAELVRLYANENEALRKENAELFVSREVLLRDQELVCRENERLLKKMGDTNRPTLSENTIGKPHDTDIWTNPVQSTKKIPEAIRKELEKRQIGNGLLNVHRRHSSLDNLQAIGPQPVRIKSSESDGNPGQRSRENSSNRRFSVAQFENDDNRATLTTPVLPERMEFSGKSRTLSANTSNPPPINGVHINSSVIKDTLQMPKIVNSKKNGNLFGSLISLKGD